MCTNKSARKHLMKAWDLVPELFREGWTMEVTGDAKGAVLRADQADSDLFVTVSRGKLPVTDLRTGEVARLAPLEPYAASLGLTCASATFAEAARSMALEFDCGDEDADAIAEMLMGLPRLAKAGAETLPDAL